MMKGIILLLAIGSACAEIPGIWLKNVTFAPKIIRGENASVDEFPYMVSLERRIGGHACGGSVLTKNWILTAAHCCKADAKEKMYIYAGSIYLDKGGSEHNIEKVIIHKNYQPDYRWRNDICLMRVTEPFSFGKNLQQITLPPQDWSVQPGDNVLISGWGYTVIFEGLQEVSNILKKATDITTLSNEQCGKESETVMFPGYICARGRESRQGICNGDSGSPLVKEGVQVGIASWVFLPCASGKPDFYCRVPNYINWIKENLGSEASELKFKNI